MTQYGFGAERSKRDYRTITHETLAFPLYAGGVDYLPADIENQRKEGICTAASMVMNAQKATGKKYSIDFQYLLQKKFIDQNWIEGSSIFTAMKVGYKYGFLPADKFSYVTEADRDLPYAAYIAKLVAIPDTEISRLLALCESKLAGYAQVDVSSAQSVQKAILDSKAGVIARFEVGKEWFTPSWDSKDIDPLQPPAVVISGHAINEAKFANTVFSLANSWSPAWNKNGIGTALWEKYRPTEAWIPYYEQAPIMVALPKASEFKHHFTTPMRLDAAYNPEVEYLQIALMILGYLPLVKRSELGFYGAKTAVAVLAFQEAKTNLSMYERIILRGRTVGPKTLDALNLIFNK